MAEEQNVHWVQDDALLDLFLRGEADPEEQERLQEHLSACPDCTVRLKEEQAIVRGIRSYARTEIKVDLKARLSSRTARRTTTYRWLGAAATLVLAVSVWYIPGEEPVLPVVSEKEATREAEKSMQNEAPMLEETTRVPEAAATARRAEPPVPTAAPDARSAIVDQTAGAAMHDDLDEGLGEAAKSVFGVAGDSEKQMTWSVAVEIPVRRERDERRQEAAADYMEARAAEKKDKTREDAETLLQKKYQLTQQPFTAADLQVQRLSSSIRPSIPVQLNESADSLILTLYPSSPWKEADLRTARVVELGPDSLQIFIGAQEFRLPRTGMQEVQE